MDDNDLLLRSFQLHLRAEHKSPKTITSYLEPRRASSPRSTATSRCST
jgi:hypothetical protein